MPQFFYMMKKWKKPASTTLWADIVRKNVYPAEKVTRI